MYEPEVIERARNIDLLNYLISNGYQLIKKTSREYRLKEHDSLVISNNKWHWHSRGIGGNTLDFLIKYEGKRLTDAVKTLVEYEFGHLDQKYEFSRNSPRNNSNHEKIELALPDKNPVYYRVFAYLSKTRKIDSAIIAELMHEGKIYESKDYHNCVFVGKDKDGVARFASERGTISGRVFRRDCLGSDKNFSFSMPGINETLYVFESPIEAMSHASIFKQENKDYKIDHRLSLGGVSTPEDLRELPIALNHYLNENSSIKKIILMLNNDSAGKDSARKIEKQLVERGYEALVSFPKRKDVNEDLMAIYEPVRSISL